jgi:hypothetical protein
MFSDMPVNVCRPPGRAPTIALRCVYSIVSTFVLGSRPWMGLVVYLGQVLEVKVRIHLGGADIRVAE